jgi:hypothetical protein
MSESSQSLFARTQYSRDSPRVILRAPLTGQFGDVPVLILELGLGGAKLEHATRFAIGHQDLLLFPSLTTAANVRHSTMLPAVVDGTVYQSGVSFVDLGEEQRQGLADLLIAEAQEQVNEWEANFNGLGWRPSPRTARSEAAQQFLNLHLTARGWVRATTSDPNQPLDGVAVAADTPEHELRVLCRTYERGDHATRELLRRVAMLAILERTRRG